MKVEKGEHIFKIIKDLYLYNRSIITDDYDKALMYLKKLIDFNIVEIPSGTECWTWIIPPKWTINEAVIKKDGEILLDFRNHPLHVAAYSQPFEGFVTKDELIKHLRWSEAFPEALVYEHIYAYHYHKQDWCLSMPYNRIKQLSPGKYYVKIDSTFSPGKMKIGEFLLPGQRKEIILIMGHLCHPGQADDGLSGVAVGTQVFQDIALRNNRKYSYLFLVVPETIGSVGYLWKRQELIPQIKYGIFLEMLGSNNSIALQRSCKGSTYIDKVAHNVLSYSGYPFREASFRELAGNDEIIFADPDVNIPMISLQRYPYPEYHTNLDNPSIISADKLEQSYEVVGKIIDILESDCISKRRFKGPVYLSRFDLYSDSRYERDINRRNWHIMQNIGSGMSMLEIADSLKINYFVLLSYLEKWKKAGLVDFEEKLS